jgi:hypothetical protein
VIPAGRTAGTDAVSQDGANTLKYAERRNGLPPQRPYVRGAPRPAWMWTVLEAAVARYGEPVPTCLCGGRMIRRPNKAGHDRCEDCGATA